MELVHELNLGDIVEFSDGMVAPEQLAEAIDWADVGVVPNRRNVFTDGILPTKLLELVATGTPAVVAHTTGVSHYFSGEMVRFFEPGDVGALAEAMREIATDPERRTALARSAATFNAAHSWVKDAVVYARTVDAVGTGGRKATRVGLRFRGRRSRR
jgi:glycosyltransferase involved in cell wall biosynthesis